MGTTNRKGFPTPSTPTGVHSNLNFEKTREVFPSKIDQLDTQFPPPPDHKGLHHRLTSDLNKWPLSCKAV